MQETNYAVSEIFPNYDDFVKSTKNLGIMCDGQAHIVATQLLTKKAFANIIATWESVVKAYPEMFDRYKGINADKELENLMQFTIQINKVFVPLGIAARFISINTPNEFLTAMTETLDSRKVINLTVKILDEGETHGHVVTMWKHNDKYLLYDINLDKLSQIDLKQLSAMYTNKLTLASNYTIVYDTAFPLEVINMLNKKLKPTLNINNIEEALGNFIRIFPELEITREELREKVELTGCVKEVPPLEYFHNVGNGMDTKSQKQEIAKIYLSDEPSSKQRAKLALDYLDCGNHIGVSHEQYERDLKNGKDHDKTIRYFLEKVLCGEKLEHCVVVKTKHATKLFGKGINKVILDGTHRAVAAAITNINLSVLEFSVD